MIGVIFLLEKEEDLIKQSALTEVSSDKGEMTMITGKGIFAWDGTERRSNRYGSFTVGREGYDGNGHFNTPEWIGDFYELEGRNVRITAEVIESRDSGHCGDLSRGIYPSRPETGELVELGVGEFFFTPESWTESGASVGIRPKDGRGFDWIDPVKLYRLHDQTVLITIIETDEVSDFAPSSGGDEDFSIITVDEGDGKAFFQLKGASIFEAV